MRIVKHLPLNEVGYHAYASGNSVSIGIEMCMNEDGDWEETVDRTARLLAVLMFDFSWDRTNIVQHNYWPRANGTRKNCPSRIRANSHGFSWNELLDLAVAYRDRIQGSFDESVLVFGGANFANDSEDYDHGEIIIPAEFLNPKD